MNPRKLFWGFLHRRECLVPTWRGWIAFTLVVIALMVMGMLKLHPFLAVIERVQAEALVVEGWVPDYVMEEAKAEFERHHYRRLYVVGGPVELGGYLSEHKTYAQLGAATLIRMGLSKDALEAVPAPFVQNDRTYSSALALKNWLHQRAIYEKSFNVISLGAHARRSRVLFQKAFGQGSRVGIIAIEARDYNPKLWWKFSQGARTTVDELVAYIYVLLISPFT